MLRYEYGNTDSKNVLIQMIGEHDISEIPEEMETIRELAGDDFCLTALRVNSWNDDLSPWRAPAVFGSEDFGGGAEKTLAEVLKITADAGKHYYIGGYSLAGLFALWAVCRTDVFEGAASASPSVWFPGFLEYLRENATRTDRIYLSLGDREEKTRNPVMQTVGRCIRESRGLLEERGTDCILEWNKGNHFKEPGRRTGRAFAWLLSRHRI